MEGTQTGQIARFWKSIGREVLLQTFFFWGGGGAEIEEEKGSIVGPKE